MVGSIDHAVQAVTVPGAAKADSTSIRDAHQMTESTIALAKPYPAQYDLIQMFKRNNLLILSRRWGKTTLCGRIHLHTSLTKENNRAAWSSPTWKLMMEAFEQHKLLLEPAIVRVSREDRRIELFNGSVLEYWSSDDISAGRGRKYHTWVADEMQRQRNIAKFIRGAVRPTLADFRGTLFVMATANGEGSELHEFYLDCIADPAWFVAHGRLEDNPYIHHEEIAQMRRDLGPEMAAQELDSQWVKVDGITPLIRKMQWDALYSEKEDTRRRRVLAIDASVSGDTTAVVGVWKDEDDITRVDYNDIMLFEPEPGGEIDFAMVEEELWKRWQTGRYVAIAYDPYQLVSLMQRLKARGVHTFEFTQNNMRMRADGHLRQLFQQQKFAHPAHDLLTDHVMNVTLKYTNEQFRFIKGGKSVKIDLAVALSMAAYTLKELPVQYMSDFVPAVATVPQLTAAAPLQNKYQLMEINRYGRR